MLKKQRKNGGWICNTVGRDWPYCIKSGVLWVFRCLAEADLIDKKSQITKRVLDLFRRHKKNIIRHGYQKDHYYRCDEALLLPGLRSVGLSESHRLVRDLRQSLKINSNLMVPGSFGANHRRGIRSRSWWP